MKTYRRTPFHFTAATTALLFGGGLSSLAAFPPPVPPPPVPGKEYTDFHDINAGGALTPGQVLLWDGLGGVANGPVLPAGYVTPPGSLPQEIDALANRRDYLFHEVSYFNAAHLLISVTDDSHSANSIWYESPDGTTGVWATKAQVNRNGVNDLDALEIWGPNGVSDSDFISLHTDPRLSTDPGGLHYSIITSSEKPVLSRDSLAAAIGLYLGAGTVNGHDLNDIEIATLIEEVHLDALMYYRNDTDDRPIDGGHPNPVTPLDFVDDEILFSIEPISYQTPNGALTLFDGGEIWTYRLGDSAGTAAFLDHGGHLWDTAFDVKGAFGVDNENMDALEAVGRLTPVPEVSQMAAAGLLGALAGLQIWRKRRAV